MGSTILPVEIFDHIIYFTTNKVTDLSLICKYFDKVCKSIRITDNENYPYFQDEHLKQLPNLTSLNLSFGKIITD